MDRRLIRLVVFVLVGAIALAAVVPGASAHAYLGESTPANGEQLDEAPEEIELSYTGDGIQVADVTVIGPDDEDVSGDAEINPDDRQEVTVPIEGAGEGMYVVEWEVLADDGHTTSGTFFFSVGDEVLDRDTVLATHEPDTEDDISLFEAGSKGLLLVAVAGLVGVPATALAVLPVARRHRSSAALEATAGALRRLCAGFGALVVVAVAAFGVARLRSFGPLSPETAAEFFGTSIGGVWLVQAVLAASVLAVTVAGLRRLSLSLLLGATGAGGVGVAATVAWASHSATAIDRLWGFAVDFVHLLAAGLWVGGLVVIAVVLPRLRERGNARLAASAVRRYSVLALAGATFTVATGFVLASWHVESTAGLSGTFYGSVLVVKLALVAVALAFGGYHRFVLLPRLQGASRPLLSRLAGGRPARSDGGREETSWLTTTVRVELVVLVCVLLLSGVLTSAATAAVVTGEEGPERATIETGLDDDLAVAMTVTPAVADATGDRVAVQENEVVIVDVVFERDGESVASDRAVELLATSPDGETTIEQELEATDDGRYSVVQTLPEHGTWEVRLTGAPDGSFESVWFEFHALPDVDHDHGGHDHGDDGGHAHGHGGDSPFDEPLALVGLLVGLYGAFAVVYEANRLRKN